MTISTKIYLLSIVLFLPKLLFSASENKTDWQYSFNVHFGVTVHLVAKKQFTGYPAVKLFAGASMQSRYRDQWMLNIANSFGLYRKTLGNGINPQNNDTQIDNVMSFNGGWFDGKSEYTKHIKTLNNVPFYQLTVYDKGGLFFGPQFIWNRYKRNQIVGVVGGTFDQFSVTYYNDGAVPISYLSIGDNFDRWWTGGGCIYWHGSNRNLIEFGFDQFTGYSGLVYELSNILGIDVSQYKTTSERVTYNSSSYQLRVSLSDHHVFETGVLGSLIFNNKFWGIQDIIHVKGDYSLHPNKDINRPFFGMTQHFINNPF